MTRDQARSKSSSQDAMKATNRDILTIATELNQDQPSGTQPAQTPALEPQSPITQGPKSRLPKNYESVKGKEIHLASTTIQQSLKMKPKPSKIKSPMFKQNKSGLLATSPNNYKPQTKVGGSNSRHLLSPSQASPLENLQSRTRHQLSSKASTVCMSRNPEVQASG